MNVTTEWGELVELPAGDAAEGSRVVAHCFAPEPSAAAELPVPIWMFAVHGAGENWTYWDKIIPGRESEPYSFARFMATRGVGVIAIDALGRGDSTYTRHGSELTLEVLALGHHQASSYARELLLQGKLISGLEPLEDLFYVGIGHSGGSAETMVQQGSHATYDAVTLLGMPSDDFLYPHRGEDALRAVLVEDEKGMVAIPERPPASVAGAFAPGTPPDVIAAFPPGRPWPPSHLNNMKNGTLIAYTRKITSPVFVGFGEVDLAGSPIQEQQRFASDDVTAYVQPGLYHHHWSSPRRLELMTAIYNWAWSRAKYRA